MSDVVGLMKWERATGQAPEGDPERDEWGGPGGILVLRGGTVWHLVLSNGKWCTRDDRWDEWSDWGDGTWFARIKHPPTDARGPE